MTADILVMFPAHDPSCQVCRGAGRMRWCSLRRSDDCQVRADVLGSAVPCLPIPVRQYPMRVDRPRGGDAV